MIEAAKIISMREIPTRKDPVPTSEDAHTRLRDFVVSVLPALLYHEKLNESDEPELVFDAYPDGVQYPVMAPPEHVIPEKSYMFWGEDGPDGEINISVGGEVLPQLGLLNVSGTPQELSISYHPLQKYGRPFTLLLAGEMTLIGDVRAEELNAVLPALFPDGKPNRDYRSVHLLPLMRSLSFYERDGRRKEERAKELVHLGGGVALPHRDQKTKMRGKLSPLG